MVGYCQKLDSGPLLGRIDVPTKLACIEVPRVEYEKLADPRLTSLPVFRTSRCPICPQSVFEVGVEPSGGFLGRRTG
jgi:hypothetical protein